MFGIWHGESAMLSKFWYVDIFIFVSFIITLCIGSVYLFGVGVLYSRRDLQLIMCRRLTVCLILKGPLHQWAAKIKDKSCRHLKYIYIGDWESWCV